MLKNLAFLGTLLMILSCSSEQEPIKESDENLRNTIRSFDPQGYESPYNSYAKPVQYSIHNFTDELTLKYKANIGLTYFDGDYGDITQGSHYFGMPRLGFPNLLGGVNQKFINTVKANQITVSPHNHHITFGGHCPVLTTQVQYFNIPIYNQPELGTLYEFGKVYTIDFYIEDLNLNLIVPLDTIKVRFIDDSYDASGNPLWQPLLGATYNSTGEQLLYHVDTNEIVIENSPQGIPSIRYFSYNGEEYYITSYTTDKEFRIILDKLEL